MAVKRPTSIGDIEFDALMSETLSYSSDVPQYPVESGHSVADDIITGPLTISATLLVSDMPVTWKNRFSGQKNRVTTVRNKLIILYKDKTPVVYRSSSGTYRDMAIESLELPKTNEAKSMEISITLKQIRVTKAKTVDIASSYSRSGGTGQYTGSASTSNASGDAETAAQEQGSILYGIVDSFQAENSITNIIGSIIGGGEDD